jgi:hypothetical protein
LLDDIREYDDKMKTRRVGVLLEPPAQAIEFYKPLENDYKFKVQQFLSMRFINIIEYKILNVPDIEILSIGQSSNYMFNYLDSVNHALRYRGVSLTPLDIAEIRYLVIYGYVDVGTFIHMKILYNYLIKYSLSDKCTKTAIFKMLDILETGYYFNRQTYLITGIDLNDEFKDLYDSYIELMGNPSLKIDLRIADDIFYINQDNMIDYSFKGIKLN